MRCTALAGRQLQPRLRPCSAIVARSCPRELRRTAAPAPSPSLPCLRLNTSAARARLCLGHQGQGASCGGGRRSGLGVAGVEGGARGGGPAARHADGAALGLPGARTSSSLVPQTMPEGVRAREHVHALPAGWPDWPQAAWPLMHADEVQSAHRDRPPCPPSLLLLLPAGAC